MILDVVLIIAAIALGVGVGTFGDLRCEVVRLKSLNNDVASQNVYYREKNNKLEDENTALKLKINEMEESRRATLEHNAYLSKEAIRLNEKNIELNEENTRLRKQLDVYNKCYRVVVTETVAKFKDKFKDAVKYRVMTPTFLGPLPDGRSFELGVKYAEQDDISLVNKIADEIEKEIDNGCSD